MQNSKVLSTALNAVSLHAVFQYPMAAKKVLCIYAALCPVTKEFQFVTADGVQHAVSTSAFKSTDKADVEWHNLEILQLGAIIAFGEYKIAIKDLLDQIQAPQA